MSVLVSHPTLVGERTAVVVRSGVARLLSFAAPGVLIFAALSFGAVTIPAGLALAGVSWALLMFYVVDGVRRGELRIAANPLALPVFLLMAFTAMHWAGGLSVAPVATRLEWLRWLGYCALAAVAVQVFDTRRRLLRLAAVLATAGFLIAVLGIAQYLTAGGKIYWLIEPSQGGWIFGPYVNRNHFAGLMELWIPLALGMALVPENSVPQRWMWSAMALVMAAAVVLSGSRGGMVALGAELAVFMVVAAGLRGGRRAVVGLTVALVLIAGTVYSLDRGEILERFQQTLRPNTLQQEEAAGLRLQAWAGTIELFRRNWMMGSGLDTFATLFPAVRSFPSDKIWTHAHNDFLQFLAETGVVGAALALWMFVAGGAEAFRNLAQTSGTATGAVLAGIFTGCVGFLVHGWLDFNFHVPANAANFAVLAATLTRCGWDEI